MHTLQARDPVYFLGHSDDELRRLVQQSRIFNPLTEDVLRDAGIDRGMRVLDVGCGAGDVSFLITELVGPTGAVVGIDRSGEAIAVARRRAAAAGLENVTFVESDITDFSTDRPVDAAVGRLVLMYQGDRVAAVRRVAEQVRPGGLIVFHEMDLAAGGDSHPACRLWDTCMQWLRETFRRAQIDLRTGLSLHEIFTRAGLEAPRTIMHARIEGGWESEAYGTVAATVRTCLPMMERCGVATAGEVGIDTLAERLRDEVVGANAVVVTPMFVGAWARTPS